jgi:hypothetical protein
MVGYKICSWDVGIKHLAYCVLEDTTEGPRIREWGVINLVESDIMTCDMTHKKTGELCDKKALTYGLLTNGKTINYCGTHKSDHPGCPFDWEETNVKHIDTNDKLCKHMIKDRVCDKKAKFIINGNNLCAIHKTQEVNRVKKLYQLVPIKKKNSYDTDPFTISTRMFAKLDEIKPLLDVDEVLIENQPSLKNPTMKTVASFLFSYFAMRGVVDKQKSKMHIRFFSPSNKLKLSETEEDRIYKLTSQLIKKHLPSTKENYNEKELIKIVISYLVNKNTTIAVPDEDNSTGINKTDLKKYVHKIEKDPKNYELTKLLSIRYTEILLKAEQPDLLDKFNSFKKKDDPCDACLQGRKYLITRSASSE